MAANISSATSAAGRQLVQANALIHSYHVVFWVAAGIYVGAAALTALLLRSGVALPQEAPRSWRCTADERLRGGCA